MRSGTHSSGMTKVCFANLMAGFKLISSLTYIAKRIGEQIFLILRSTRVWNPCVVITVPFQNRSSRVILSKMRQMGQYKKGVSH